ncbi:hypothetical protein LY71_12439 [Geodermatophilus tzadiensis]|uniref:Lamin tail-like protein n=2 Tax=Geodermatophilus tzadiensis TaxID=1137988 RepID=A0A2T0SUT2_9ACTN|nr:hypothetical protein LY71_12439 [Geodermatophilus tzadiensis]
MVLLAVATLLLTGAGSATAHTNRGVAASDYMPGASADVRARSRSGAADGGFGDSLELCNRSAETVTVYGYSDEEYLRIGPDGVWRNANSPATYINGVSPAD